MDDLAWQILKYAFWPLLALFLGAAFAEPIKALAAPIAFYFGSHKESLGGTWLATFSYGHGSKQTPFQEVIQLKKFFGFVVGRIVPHEKNHERLKAIEKNGKTIEQRRPIRLTGKFENNHYLTGYWFHPSHRSYYHGAFQVVANQSFRSMRGRWVGYSDSKQRAIDHGEWNWERLD